MKIVIADDEPLARQRLVRLLKAMPDQHQVCAEAADGVQALEACQAHQPDVVLLDIRMPRLDGLATAQSLARLPHPPAVVFVTAYDEHALQAFEAQAMDYLLKPIRHERLQQALEKLARWTPSQADRLRSQLQANAEARETLCAHTAAGLHLIDVAAVRFFRADQKYVTVRTEAGEWLIEDALKDLEQEFAPAFLRVHRNALVALCYVEGLIRQSPGQYAIQLQGVADQISVSRRHLPGVRRVLRQTG